MNRFVWDLNYTSAESLPGAIVWGGMPTPGPYPANTRRKCAWGRTSKR